MLSPRITIRLSPILAAKVGPRGNVADVVRQALEAYLEGEPHDRQPSADTADTATAAGGSHPG
jgi:hypothetical protein